MKKWISIFLAILITATVLFGFNEFNGNFISKQLAKSALKEYLAAHYPNEHYQFDKGLYNFKFDSYDFDVTFYEPPNNWTYTFEVGPKYIPTSVQTKTLHYDSRDEVKSDEWSNLGGDYIKKQLQDLPIQSVYYGIDVPKNFPHNEWTPDVNMFVLPSISVDLTYFKGETKNDFFEIVLEIQKRLNRSSLQYDDVFITMNEKIDNQDGKIEGYASIYYERKYSVFFQANSKLSIFDIN